MHYCWPRCWMPFIGALDCVSNFSLNLPLHPECKGHPLSPPPYLQSLLGMSELSVNCALLKGENRSNRSGILRHLCTYILPLSNLIERDTHALSLCLLLPLFPVNEISSFIPSFFLFVSFFFFFFFFFFKGILSDEMEFILRLTREIYKKCHSRIQVTRSIKFIEVPTLFREELKFRDFKIHQSSD